MTYSAQDMRFNQTIMYQIIKDLRVGILAHPQINNKLIYKTLQKTPKTQQ